MLDHHEPNDSLFVYDSMPFYIPVGDTERVRYAFDQWHSGDPSEISRPYVGGIVEE